MAALGIRLHSTVIAAIRTQVSRTAGATGQHGACMYVCAYGGGNEQVQPLFADALDAEAMLAESEKIFLVQLPSSIEYSTIHYAYLQY